jgi:hypothetical protein
MHASERPAPGAVTAVARSTPRDEVAVVGSTDPTNNGFMTDKKTYLRPVVCELGTVEQLTLANLTGSRLDGAYLSPTGQIIGAIPGATLGGTS